MTNWIHRVTVTLAIAVCLGSPSADSAAPQTLTFLGLTAKLPAAWEREETASSMRVAQCRVPAATGEGDAQLVLFYFGQGQGGSAHDNIVRWQSQFTTPSGAPVVPIVEHLTVDGMEVTIAEFTGSYGRTIGMGGDVEPVPGQTLIAAIVQTPRGKLFIQLHGPAATVSSQRKAYLDFINSIRSSVRAGVGPAPESLASGATGRHRSTAVGSQNGGR